MKNTNPKKILKIFYAFFSVGILAATIGAFADVTFLTFLGMIVMIASLLLHIALYRCPHCGEYLFRSTGEYCPSCGEKLYK